jgi:hypothetical protein
VIEWFFLGAMAGAYIGPMTQAQCDQVAAAIPTLGHCTRSVAFTMCSEPGGSSGKVCLVPLSVPTGVIVDHGSRSNIAPE